MGNANRFKRHMTDNPWCFVCGAPEESTLHIVRDCPAARVVWKRVGGPANSPHFFHGDVKQWVTDNLSYADVDETPIWATYFGITVWWLWRWRNNLVFGKQHENPVDIGAFLRVRYNEARRALDESKDVSRETVKEKIESNVQWLLLFLCFG